MKGPIARATIRTSAVLALRLFTQALNLLLVARLLGPGIYGAFAGFVSLAVTFGMLSTFGTNFILLAETSILPKHRSSVLSYGLPFTLLLGTCLLALFMLVSLAVLKVEFVGIDVLLAIGTTELLLQPALSFPSAELQAANKIASSQLLLTLPLFLRLATACLIWHWNFAEPLRDYAYGYFLASVTALIFVNRFFSYSWPAPREWRLPTFGELRRATGYAALNVTAAAPAELDKVLAFKFLPIGSAGIYASAARVVSAITLPVVAMMLAAMPRLFREVRTEAIRHLHQWTLLSAFGYGSSLAVVLCFVAPSVESLFGNDYRGLSRFLRWLAPAVPAMALRIAGTSTLMSTGRIWIRVGLECTGLLLLIAVTSEAVHRFSNLGLPIALACAEWSMALISIYFIWTDKQSIPKNTSV